MWELPPGHLALLWCSGGASPPVAGPAAPPLNSPPSHSREGGSPSSAWHTGRSGGGRNLWRVPTICPPHLIPLPAPAPAPSSWCPLHREAEIGACVKAPGRPGHGRQQSLAAEATRERLRLVLKEKSAEAELTTSLRVGPPRAGVLPPSQGCRGGQMGASPGPHQQGTPTCPGDPVNLGQPWPPRPSVSGGAMRERGCLAPGSHIVTLLETSFWAPRQDPEAIPHS